MKKHKFQTDLESTYYKQVFMIRDGDSFKVFKYDTIKVEFDMTQKKDAIIKEDFMVVKEGSYRFKNVKMIGSIFNIWSLLK